MATSQSIIAFSLLAIDDCAHLVYHVVQRIVQTVLLMVCFSGSSSSDPNRGRLKSGLRKTTKKPATAQSRSDAADLIKQIKFACGCLL
jgi:hypothetical protein